MRTEKLEKLLRFVSPHAPGLPYEMSLDLVRSAYTDFCASTGLLTLKANLEVQRGVRDYTLKAPDGFEVYAVADFEARHLSAVDTFGRSHRRAYSVISNNTIELAVAPSKDYVMTDDLYLTLIPTETTTEIAADLYTRFAKGIAAGAIADACELPNQPFSDPGKAQLYRREFARTKQKGRNLAITNRNSQVLSFAPIRVV